MPSIKVSPKHGLNPTIPTCFFCGKSKNEIALLGKLRGDVEAPMHSIIDMEPCDDCKAKMDQGYTMLGVQHNPIIKNQPPVQDGLYLTGNYIVLSEQGVRNIMPANAIDVFLEKKTILIEQEVLDMINNANVDKTEENAEETNNGKEEKP